VSVDRSLESLAPVFLHPFVAWLKAAGARVPHVELRVTETRRTLARQEWLFAQGRTPPHDRAPVVTWTVDSRHRWGLAADLAMVRKDTGAAIWEVSSWQWLYRAAPLEPFGLRHIGPREWVHVELLFADEAIELADRMKLTQT